MIYNLVILNKRGNAIVDMFFQDEKVAEAWKEFYLNSDYAKFIDSWDIIELAIESEMPNA